MRVRTAMLLGFGSVLVAGCSSGNGEGASTGAGGSSGASSSHGMPTSSGSDSGGSTGTGSDTDGGTTGHGFSISCARPRLFWNADRLAQAKTWWKHNSFAPGSASDYLADQGKWMAGLFAAEMTGDCDAAVSAAMQVDLSDCTPDKNGCDDARWFGEVAIVTYDWCNSAMTDAQKATFTSNWNQWLKNIDAESWGGVPMSQSNYYFGNLRNDIEWGIASYCENKTAAEQFLEDGLVTRYQADFIPASVADGKGAGGLGLEGGEYGRYQAYYAGSMAFPTVEIDGRDIWNETPYWKGTVLNRIYMTPPMATTGPKRTGWDVFPFGDDEDWQNGSPATDGTVGDFMSIAANQWQKVNIGAWARQWLKTVNPDIDAFDESVDEGGAGLAFTSLPLDYYDAGPRYLAGRSDWTSKATGYLFQMGDAYSDGHGHADWGTFQIHRGGRFLTRETTGYTESVPSYGGTGTEPLADGIAHNVPLIDGSAAVGPYGASSNGSPLVKRLESQATFSYADVDLTPIYRNDDCAGHPDECGNAAASHVERELWFLRDIEAFVVLDRLQADTAARSRTFVFHCETNPSLVDAHHAACINGSQELYVSTLLPAMPSSRTVVDESCCGANPPSENAQFRVEINDQPGATVSYSLHVLQAMDANGTPLTPSVTDSAPGTPGSGTLTVHLDGQHTLTLLKGTTSSGGSITIQGSTTNLRANAQTITVGDSGPVWGP